MKCPKCGHKARGVVSVIYTGQNYFLTCNTCQYTEWLGDDEQGKSIEYYRLEEYFKFDSKFNRDKLGAQTIETCLLLD